MAIAQNSVDNVTMMKLGGAGNIADSTSPPQIDTRHSTVAITLAMNGEATMAFAVAAGVMAAVLLGIAVVTLVATTRLGKRAFSHG